MSFALTGMISGCSNRAHSDLYQQRMASEIRVLEDQLYDADYQNRVLREELERCKTKPSADCPVPPTSAKPPPAASYGPALAPPVRDVFKTPDDSQSPEPLIDPVPDPTPDATPDSGDEMDLGFETELELPSIDEGTPVEPSLPTDTDAPKKNLPPAPGGPEPPSKADTAIPKVEPGDILPPPAKEDGEAKPPGQIELDDLRTGGGVPENLQLHAGLSGGYRFEDDSEGMMIVVNVVDQFGKTVNLDGFDIDAELSVVIMDPEAEPDQARLGRWDFPARNIPGMIRNRPMSAIHIPIAWQERHPIAKNVTVHVRLRADEDEMRCEGDVKVTKLNIASGWGPRGDSRRE